ncbi:hypothetical protein FF125_00075 [Aureibaculum algae]|uniref:Uncharacterized protein n=1 Tax=Aureibaculum algae TaxID=2584122 RepID=A0A5B7TNY6_9FLAO|nr:hypothetical protein [Aureibaculum algae]QCX36904.1 hypothetical protein FF125_00075 [Aureibaculum algae]
MKTKLKKFTDFSQHILPHEATYLSAFHQFKDPEKTQIIELVITNALSENNPVAFNQSIDKRKYSYIKKWINNKLTSIDVDIIINWIMLLKNKVLTDAITATEEKHFLQYIIQYKTVDYNFQNLYELVKDYKPYLLVRMRYNDHQIVADFLKNYEDHYTTSTRIDSKLYNATTDITNQYSLNNNEPKFWEKWLLKIFQTTEIDGKNRYQAFVLLAFMYTNYNESEKLKKIFDQIDVFFGMGQMYSRRILSNYYASRVLMHSRKDELKKAEYYAFLSIRQENNDTLMYLNNLVSILLKNSKPKKANALMAEYINLFNETHNYHQKLGYASNQIRILTELNKLAEADNYAKKIIKKYKSKIIEHRWHHFFTSYINVLVIEEKYDEVLKITSKFNLIAKEKERKKKGNYVPNISWSISLSRYMEGKINATKLLEEIKEPINDKQHTLNQKQHMIKVIDKLSKNLPEAFLQLKSYL